MHRLKPKKKKAIHLLHLCKDEVQDVCLKLS